MPPAWGFPPHAARPKVTQLLLDGRLHGPAARQAKRRTSYELAPSTVTARRFCDQQEMSLQTATGLSFPYEIVRIRCAWIPREIR
jgi:hypothetical protein